MEEHSQGYMLLVQESGKALLVEMAAVSFGFLKTSNIFKWNAIG